VAIAPLLPLGLRDEDGRKGCIIQAIRLRAAWLRFTHSKNAMIAKNAIAVAASAFVESPAAPQ
jgi:hypothetical protein